MSRNVMLAGVVGVVVLAAGLGWFFGSQIRSPAELAAEAEPPPASNITVEVVSEELSADVITRGDIVYDEPVQVGLSGSFASQPERLIVTQAMEQGVELSEGDLVVEVVGRPVFLLTGEIPMYRDLRPGSSGDDVLQLEQALAGLGFLEGTPDASWDDNTGAAVAAWYEASGYRANGLSEEDETALSAARDRVRSAETAVADALAALSETGEGGGRSARLAAEGEVEAAKDALELAELDRNWANEDAVAAQQQATSDLAAAVKALERARAADPPTPQDELAELENAVTEGQVAVATAGRNVERVAAEQEALVAQAKNRLEVAEASLAELRRGVDTSGMERQVTSARDELTAAQEELADLEAELGTWLPAGELVFLDRLPVRVDQVSVARGSEISGPFVTVTGSLVTMRAAVSESDALLLEEGMAVQIENPEGDTSIPGVILSVADRPGTNSVAADRVYVEIEPEELPQELIGQNVRVVIPVSSTGGEVLAVPAAALYATADGSTRVEVEDADGTLRIVTVETGLAADGLVEISPVDGEIAEGDLVVVGRADGSRPGDEEAEEDSPDGETEEDAPDRDAEEEPTDGDAQEEPADG
jgi:peptidoglycan hydrolase-like protein with peptidoglycan-binding domain